jgi:hypothetical protein
VFLYSTEQGEGKRLERKLLSLCSVDWKCTGDLRETLGAIRSLTSHREECNLGGWRGNIKPTNYILGVNVYFIFVLQVWRRKGRHFKTCSSENTFVLVLGLSFLKLRS